MAVGSATEGAAVSSTPGFSRSIEGFGNSRRLVAVVIRKPYSVAGGGAFAWDGSRNVYVVPVNRMTGIPCRGSTGDASPLLLMLTALHWPARGSLGEPYAATMKSATGVPFGASS